VTKDPLDPFPFCMSLQAFLLDLFLTAAVMFIFVIPRWPKADKGWKRIGGLLFIALMLFLIGALTTMRANIRLGTHF